MTAREMSVRTRVIRLLLLLAAVLLAACGAGGLPLPQDTYDAVTATPLATATAAFTPTPITEDASGYGRAFFRAWEAFDYLAMFSLLAPESQALIDSQSFVQRYEESMAAAAVLAVHAQPLAARQENDRAEMTVRVTWDTAAVGQITREHTVPLVYDEGRWGVVWNEGLILPELEGGSRLYTEYRIPSRANIYDREGRALAFQGKVISLGIIPGTIEDEEGLLAVLAELLEKEPDEIKARYESAQPEWYVPIGDIAESEMQEHVAELQPYIGAGLAEPQARPARLYGETGLAAHLVGYIGFIPAEQLEDYLALGYQGDEVVGRSGMELWGEDYLNGAWGGRLSVIGTAGETLATVQEREPRQARSLYSSIDLDFQASVEQALAEAINSYPLGKAGAIVVLDVNNGAVRAMASYPTYDPVVFDTARPNADAELLAVLNNPGQPLLNRAAQGVYPAGSIFKIITMSAALNSGLYTPETRYTSTGQWSRLGDDFVKYDWLPGGHGTVSLRTALTVSCNSCFYDVGYTLDGANSQLLPDTARQFGLGQPTGIQGVAESPGLIPDPAWKLANIGDGWATGDAVNMAIGQGYVQVTPLQIANFMAALANGGTLYAPTLVDRLGPGGGAPEEALPPQARGRLPLTDEQLDVIRDSLWNVTHASYGTATHQFGRMAVPVAGKTGTAEAPPNEPHAWFAGYAPAAPYTGADGVVVEEPEIAVVVLMENAGEGSAVAAPIFRRVVELYYGIEPVTPYPWQ